MISHLDHLVLTVRDFEATRRFYADGLGMTLQTFADGRQALHFGQQKINLHRAGHEFEPKAARPVPGSADLCFIAGATLPEIVLRMGRLGFQVLEGPVERTGATGAISSVYFRDPDGNLIEVARPL